MNDRVVPLAITCAIALASGLGLVLTRNLVRCVCLLLVHSLAIAAAYFVLSAEFLAMGQLVVHAGAIVVLFLFVVLLLPRGGTEGTPAARRLLLGLGAGGVMLGGLVVAIGATMAAARPSAVAVDLSAAAVARSLFGPLLVPFELTAIVLLIAIVACVTLWQRREGEERP